MTTAHTAPTGQATLAATTSGIARWIADLRAAWAKHRAYLETLEELRSLTDKELADIGVSRLSLREIARESVYG